MLPPFFKSVSAPDAYMLVDATSGRVAGPFEPGSEFNADGLLSQHTNIWNGTPPALSNRTAVQAQR